MAYKLKVDCVISEEERNHIYGVLPKAFLRNLKISKIFSSPELQEKLLEKIEPFEGECHLKCSASDIIKLLELEDVSPEFMGRVLSSCGFYSKTMRMKGKPKKVYFVKKIYEPPRENKLPE